MKKLVFVVLLCSCAGSPAAVSVLPPREWRTTGDALMKENGRIYLTGAKGAALRTCAADLDERPCLMVRMYDSLPGAVWTLFVERGGERHDLLKTVEEGEWLLPVRKATGWKGAPEFTLGIELSGRKGDWIVFDYLDFVRFDAALPGRPEPYAPADGTALRAPAVHFQWRQADNATAYELEYGRARDFAGSRAVRMESPFITDYLWHLPEQELEVGDWFWRVRALNIDGRSGGWSDVRRFAVSAESKPRPLERAVSADKPLLVLFSDCERMRENWASLPERVRESAYLRLEALPVERIEDVCRTAQENRIPVLVQITGPHDYYGRTSSRVPLSEVERFFQRFDMVKGVFACEQACQFEGLKNPNVRRYLDRAIRLSAQYGKLVVWADGHWGRHQWLELAADDGLRGTVERCRNLVPVWKMNCGLTPYAVHGALLGLWLGGSVDAWGVEPENWYWFEAGFGARGEQAWFKEGATDRMPPSFYGQMMLVGAMSGASVYVIEPPSAVWEAPGVLTANWRENLFPLVKRMLDDRIIPDRDAVRARVKHALALEKPPVWQADYGELKGFYDRVHGPRSIFDMLPKKGGYFAPLFWRRKPDLPEGTPEVRQDSALCVEVGDTFFAMNSVENAESRQEYVWKLSGSFESLEGTLQGNEYLVARRIGRDRLDLLLCGGRARIVAAPGVRPKAPAGAVWDEPTRTLEVRQETGRTVQVVVEGGP